ncbi:lysine 2,3-aminomutase YodO family protein [Desulfatibacillum aliphaticivorans]|uniref:Lysine 2,3-aminomutase YodO family protein n=1 Tax=Desulfatibacillum aliphaticivorans TaxID=218208 RepID=B8FIP6_DESAL|nr:KamA family radical SAM protein [Desulfatibacillum aliphaticivorans]ACL04287.1 lysine 2,3-aminomutase YodO family protein [Desulfatibacillum aliphaticivorans]
MKDSSVTPSLPPWLQAMADCIISPDGLSRILPIDFQAMGKAAETYPMRITKYFLSLIREQNDPIARQVIPSAEELSDASLSPDPLCEEDQSPVPGLIHRYPHHVLFQVENRCAVYCRHCLRKRKVGGVKPVTAEALAQGVDYIRSNQEIREVVLSGGDPLVMEDDKLLDLLRRLRAINHVRTLRVHSRIPGVLPQRITPELAKGLADFHPLYMNIQFNHPREITPESEEACRILADQGVPLGCQTVLLKGVNDDEAVLRELMEELLRIRVRPYYLHQLDRVKGAAHFHVPISRGVKLMQALRGSIPGTAIPHYVVDLPGGGGKAPLPESIVGREENAILVRNFEGKIFRYEEG